MKKILIAFLIPFTLILSGCLDTYNDITINDDGSGVMITKIDMSAMMSMMASMGGSDEEIKQDTSFLLSSLITDSENMTDAEKALFKNAKMGMKMDTDEGAFFIDISIPFSKMEDLNKINEIMKREDFLGNSLNKLKDDGNEEEETEEDQAGLEMLGMSAGGKNPMPDLSNFMKTTYEHNKIASEIKAGMDSVLAADETFSKMREAMEQGLPPIRFIYTYNLPRPASKAEGKAVVLSDDKKKVTIENTLEDLFSDPSKFAYSIEF